MKIRRFFTVVLLFAALPAMAGNDKIPAALPEDCVAFLEKIPSDWERGWITAPRDWSRPGNGETVSVFYYGNWKHHPGQIPLVMFNGGPAGNSWSLLARWQAAPESKDYPAVFFDQRGNGCSTRYPNRLPENRAEALRLREFAAPSILRDVEKIRLRVMGRNAPWRAFGQSYGSVLVHRYVELYPRSLISARAHGWAPIANPNDYRRLYREHFLIAAEAFFDARPALRDALLALYRRQTSSVCAATEPCPYALLDETWIKKFPLEEKHAELEGEIALFLVRGETETLIRPVKPAAPMEFPFSPEFAAMEVIARFDYRNREYRPEDPYGCLPGMATLEREWAGRSASRLLLSSESFRCEGRWLDAEPLRAWIVKPMPASDPLTPFMRTLKRHPGLKFFLYSGREDQYSPRTYFEQERALLGSRITFRVFTGDHFAYFKNPDFWRDLAE